MLRFFNEYIAEGNFTNESTVIIPILTGKSSMSVVNMYYSNSYPATIYTLRNHFLSPLEQRYLGRMKTPILLRQKLIDACGGVAMSLIQLGELLASLFPGESENVKNYAKRHVLDTRYYFNNS
ncbi:5505_t:CDS:2 [Funneliformis geosporum]|nr:5505_t:CDS:2 [Funneliformis geosporum]